MTAPKNSIEAYNYGIRAFERGWDTKDALVGVERDLRRSVLDGYYSAKDGEI